jgi:thymidine kinase
MSNVLNDEIHKISKFSIQNRSSETHRGTLYIRIGPMFSGKTTWLNGELTQLADKRFSVLKIIHTDDQRCDVESMDKSGSTHNSSFRELSNKIVCIRSNELKNIDVSQYHVIGVDESQFFSDLLEVVQIWVEDHGKHVRVAGLDGDSFKRKFGQTLDLIPICDQVIKLNASCNVCLNELERSQFRGNILSIEGAFTKRMDDSNEQKLVGGTTKYIPVCRYHHSLPLVDISF